MSASPIPAGLDNDPVQLLENLIRDILDIHGGQDAFHFVKDRLGNGPFSGRQSPQRLKGLFPSTVSISVCSA